MTCRLLPPEEWPRLVGTEAETVWPMLDPSSARVLVVEDGDRIVGCWILAPYWHAECVWIAPERRGQSSVARRLWGFMRQTVIDLGGRGFITAALTDEVKALIQHLGGIPMPGTHYAVRVKE
jgi:hypothetical protein